MLRMLRRSAVAATGIVLVAFGIGAWDFFNQRAEADAAKNAALLEGYVLRLVQTQDVMLTAADEALAQFARDGSYGMQAHLFLRALTERIDVSVGIAFVRNDGEFLISSTGYPASGNVGDRAYLRETPDSGIFVDRVRVQPAGIESLVIARRSATLGPAAGVWASAAEIAVLTDFLRRITPGPGEAASLIRADGTIIARNVPMTEPVVLGADQPVMRAIVERGGGVYRATAVTDGRERVYATVQIGNLPLFANYGIAIRAIWLDWALTMLIAGAVIGTVGASAYVMARYAERMLLAEAAREALAFDRRLLAEAEKTAQVRQTMLLELNHRVKNSLQMIQALIGLQRHRPQGPDLDEIGSRVIAIATIHDLLYQSGSDTEVDFGELLRRLAESDAVVPPEAGIAMRVTAEPLRLDAGIATPLALCAVELVTNAAKHAYGPGGGPIDVSLSRETSGMARLVVADRGAGMPGAGGRRSGVRVIEELVRQIDGHMEVRGDGGTNVTITFPIRQAQDRIAAEYAAS